MLCNFFEAGILHSHQITAVHFWQNRYHFFGRIPSVKYHNILLITKSFKLFQVRFCTVTFTFCQSIQRSIKDKFIQDIKKQWNSCIAFVCADICSSPTEMFSDIMRSFNHDFRTVYCKYAGSFVFFYLFLMEENICHTLILNWYLYL